MLAQQFCSSGILPCCDVSKNCCSIAGNASTVSISMVSGFFCTRPLIAAIASGRGRKEQRLTRGWRKADHFVNRIAEAHIQHAVSFIHHQRLQCIE